MTQKHTFPNAIKHWTFFLAATVRRFLKAVCCFSLIISSSDFIMGREQDANEKNFGQDVEFLKKYVETIVLRGKSGNSQVAVVPEYQGRIMTSSADGPEGGSFGWINYDYISAGKITPHINVPGGEERFWLGPEGGQFGIFFPPNSKFEFDDWKTPAVIDTEPFEVVERSDNKVLFRREAKLRNYSNTEFHLRIEREIELLSVSAASQSLEVSPGEINFVGYRTKNRITNIGKKDWERANGLLSIWLLGMYKPGSQTTVVIPFRNGSIEQLGPIVNDAYFGKVPKDRLKIRDGFIFFSGDGQYRSKIGISPQRSMGVCGSYDALRGILSIVKYVKPQADAKDYVNSMWELQDDPYSGDVINAYNDGAPEPGADPLGPFYELETSSPALPLRAGESGLHIQETYHFEGNPEELDRLSQKILDVSIQQITDSLK